MKNEELALAITEIAIKTGVVLSSPSELPFDEKGRNPLSIEESASEIVLFYRAALKAITQNN